MQENKSGSNVKATQGKEPLQDHNLNDGNHYNQPETNPLQRKKIITAIVVAMIVVAAIIIIAVSVGSSMKGIEVLEEQLVTNPYYAMIGNNLYPIVVVKVKNTSNTTKKISFEANFYADGKLLGDGQANYITLAPGDEAFLHAQSDKGYRAWSSHAYSYKITKWHIYS